jgi:hypothetical protein
LPEAPYITTASDTRFCQGDSVRLTVTNTSGFQYKWKLNGGVIGTGTGFTAIAAGNYIAEVTNTSGCSVSSMNTVAVSVDPKPSLPVVNISGPTTICQGGSVELSVSPVTGYLYQWENNGSGLPGATNSNIVIQSQGVYNLKISNSFGCYIKTENTPVNVLTAPSAPSIFTASATTFCQGDSLVLSVTNTPGYSYQWRLNGGSVSTNSGRYYAKASGSYDLVVTNSSGCSAVSVAPVAVIVKPLPDANAISITGVSRFCSGQNATLSVPLNNAYSYSWKNGSSLMGLTSNSVNVTESGEYTVVTSLDGCSVTPHPVKIEVVAKPAKPDIDMGSYTKGMCLQETPPVLSVDNIVNGYSYQWYKNETPFSSNTSIEVTESANYYLEAASDICTSGRDTALITFDESLAKPVIAAKGPTVWILSTPAKAARYKWYFNGTQIAGATTSSYVAGQNMGTYRVAISNDGKCFYFSDVTTIPDIVGIEEPDPFRDVKVYPNPTTGLFTIEMNNNIFGELVMDIFTQNGSKALNIRFEKSTEHFRSQIDLTGQSKGLYLLNLSLDKYRAVRKVVVE